MERGLIPGMTRSADEPAPAIPWHLKFFGLALVLYLSLRAFQIIDWVLRVAHYTHRRHTGCGAVWLARLTGGQEVGSSNLPSPTV